MKRVEFSVNDATYDAILEEARNMGQANTRDRGKGVVCRRALRYWLNQQHHKVAILDMDDDSYAAYEADRLAAVSERPERGAVDRQ